MRFITKRMVLEPTCVAHSDYGSFHAAAETTISIPDDSSSSHSDDSLPSQLSPGQRHGGSAVEVTSLTSDMTRDQRQPLLPLTGAGDAWKGSLKGHSPTIEYYDDVDQTYEHRKTVEQIGGGSGVVQIDVPVALREAPRFPQEKWKTLIAFLVLVVNMFITTCSLALVHERVPDRDTTAPLSDVVLDNIAPIGWALDVSEILIMVSTNSVILMIVFHKHKYIVMRRIFMILSLLYLMRSITMFVTVLPMASKTYFCSPKSNNTGGLVVVQRAWQLISGFGLSINGKHTYCGDFIYSGHTVILCMAYLIVAEYSPKRCYLIHWVSFGMSTVGIIMVLLAHGHYTIDIIIAYYVTTTLFWIYHTLANNANLKQSGPNNYLARCWWFPLFAYFERNVDGPVPRQYGWPLPWPRRCIVKPSNRNS